MGFLTNFYGFRGYLALARQKRDDAEKYLSKAWDQGLEKTSYLTAYGSLLMQKGEYAKCKEVYEKAFEGLGVNVAYYTAIRCSIITCKYKLGEVEEALVEAKEMYPFLISVNSVETPYFSKSPLRNTPEPTSVRLPINPHFAPSFFVPGRNIAGCASVILRL